MKKEGEIKGDNPAAPRSRVAWEPMTLTRVGNLEAIQNNATGSFSDSGGQKMTGASDLALKREVQPISGALERLKAIRTA